MKYSVALDASEFIIAAAAGEWDAAADDEFVRTIVRAVAESRCPRILLDIRDLTNIDLSTLRLYDRARMLHERRRNNPGARARVAILHAPADEDNRESYQFFEDTARNRGLPYRLFEDREAALDWLRSDQKT
jgi:hypothetical protein